MRMMGDCPAGCGDRAGRKIILPSHVRCYRPYVVTASVVCMKALPESMRFKFHYQLDQLELGDSVIWNLASAANLSSIVYSSYDLYQLRSIYIGRMFQKPTLDPHWNMAGAGAMQWGLHMDTSLMRPRKSESLF